MSTVATQLLSVQVASNDALDVRHFQIVERMSSLFEVSIVAVSDNPDIDFEAVVGQPMSFTLTGGAVPQSRTWNGVCCHLQQTAAEERGLSTYALTLVPALWLATQRRNHRMFQLKSEIDIVREVLGDWGISPVLKLSGVYKKRKYRVQYGESDYAFICRMLEDAGVAFYFECDEGETKLVLHDAPQVNEPRPPIAFRDKPNDADREHVTRVGIERRIRPGKYTVRDVDYRMDPTYKLVASVANASGVEERLERFHYVPGAFLFEASRGDATPSADDKGKYRTDETEGQSLAQRRLEAKRASAKMVSFETNTVDPAPGIVLSFLDHPRSDLAAGKRFLIIESTWTGAANEDWTHQCRAVSAAIPYRPPLATPKPKTNGVESATVVGAPGEEIHTDEFGRVRVHFHWDRESRMNNHSSCWIPVSQPWGGAGYGGSNLPRVGQEVIVDFLSGDPDRPVIVGRVYTNLQQTPYKLPDNKTQSGLKSHSSPGGGGFNEMRFEDAKGREQVYIQAEKNLDKLVKNDETITIGHDRTETVKHDESVTIQNDRTKLVQHDESITVGNNRTKAVGNNEDVTVGNNRTKAVGNNEDITIGKNRAKNVGMNEREVVGMNRTRVVGVNEDVKVGKNRSVKVGGKQSVSVAKASSEMVGLAKTVMVGGLYSITVGASMHSTVGLIQSDQVGLIKKVKVGRKLELKCGKSKLVMRSSGKITLEGTEIAIKGTKIVIKGTKSVVAAGNEIVLNADATALVQGGTVQVVGDPIDLN